MHWGRLSAAEEAKMLMRMCASRSDMKYMASVTHDADNSCSCMDRTWEIDFRSESPIAYID